MIVEATLAHLLSICYRMEEEQRREWALLSWSGKFMPDEVAMKIAQNMSVGLVLLDDQKVPQAAGGFSVARPGVLATWMVGTDEMNKHILELTRATKRAIKAALEGDEVKRIETVSSVEHEAAHKWYRLLGLNKEAVLAAYAGGVDFLMFGRVA